MGMALAALAKSEVPAVCVEHVAASWQTPMWFPLKIECHKIGFHVPIDIDRPRSALSQQLESGRP